MANECFYELRAKGKKEYLDVLLKWIQCDDYQNEFHFYRTDIGGFCINSYHEDDESDDWILDCTGDCAWSIQSSFRTPSNFESKVVSIEDFCKHSKVDIEMWSEECGMCFAEHFGCDGDGVYLDECHDYEEDWDDESGECIVKKAPLDFFEFKLLA